MELKDIGDLLGVSQNSPHLDRLLDFHQELRCIETVRKLSASHV